MLLYHCLFKALIRSCALLYHHYPWWLLLQSVSCPQDLPSWMCVCWWQCVEEGVACEELHSATGKYFEGSATASFNSRHSPCCSKYFSSPRCFREFWGYTAARCVLWMVFSAHCPSGEVFWFFRPRMLYNWNTHGILLKQKHGTFYVQCYLCLPLIMKTFISFLSTLWLGQVAEGAQRTCEHTLGTWRSTGSKAEGHFCAPLPFWLFVYDFRSQDSWKYSF